MSKPARKPADEDAAFDMAVLRRILFHGTAVLAIVVAFGFAFRYLKRYVDHHAATPDRAPTITLKNHPDWMGQDLAGEIVAGITPLAARSSLDSALLKEVADSLRFNPWVRQVRQVRRGFGNGPGDTLEIDCEYRTPVALVTWKGQHYLVDGEGVRLPPKFPIQSGKPPRILFDRNGHLNLRIIEGVSQAPPLADGQRWPGDDLHAGLDLARLLYGRVCTEEILRVNVANFKGRKDPRDAQLTLLTKRNSEIRWGEPVKLPFHAELPPATKLERLALIKEKFGQIDGGYSWIDIRLDIIKYPTEERVVDSGR